MRARLLDLFPKAAPRIGMRCRNGMPLELEWVHPDPAAAEFLGEEFLVISGDALTDIDLSAFAARHRAARSIRCRSRCTWQPRRW